VNGVDAEMTTIPLVILVRRLHRDAVGKSEEGWKVRASWRDVMTRHNDGAALEYDNSVVSVDIENAFTAGQVAPSSLGPAFEKLVNNDLLVCIPNIRNLL
jgi:hypothetical protein